MEGSFNDWLPVSTGFNLAVEVEPTADDETLVGAPLGEHNGACINYYFPVQVEVVTAGELMDPHVIAELALDRLARSVRATRA
jgi:hypothetical protein